MILIPIQTANNITYVTGLSTVIISVLTNKGHLQWLKKVSQCCVILKRLENCGISGRNQARGLWNG